MPLKYVHIAVIVFLLLLWPVLIILPADFFDKGQSVCISVLLFDQACYGCGITRAIQHLIHLEFGSASAYNKLSFVVLPLLLIVWFRFLRGSLHFIKHHKDPA